jgi:GNAT superfamily N-acetyltransferase
VLRKARGTQPTRARNATNLPAFLPSVPRRVAQQAGADDRPKRERVAYCGRVARDVVITYLELDDPAGIRAADPPRLDEVAVERVDPPDGRLSRWFYAEVGRPHGWIDNLDRSEAAWQAWAEGVETWVATVGGERAGYYELRVADDDGRSVEIAYFGLLAPFQGRGLGGFLLTHALRRAFELGPRVWLHTNTQDGAAALPNYQARGLRPFRRVVRRTA